MNISKRISLLLVFGTRPELIKLIPIIKILEDDKRFELFVCNSSQHKELIWGLIEDYRIKVDFDLNVMKENQTLAGITSTVLEGVSNLIDELSPDFLVVHGDTTTAFSSALASFYKDIKLLHVEAGLRTFDRFSPFPEEFNRTAISLMSYFNFAPTKNSANNLMNLGIEPSRILITGNTVVDLVRLSFDSSFECEELSWVDHNKFILFTSHRRENLPHMDEMFKAVQDIMIKNKNLRMIYPVHKNPKVRKLANLYFSGLSNVLLTEAMDVKKFHNLMARSIFIVTDSGGVQEEAPTFGIPVVLMRTSTERPEGLNNGIILSGITYKGIQESVTNLLTDEYHYESSKPKFNPFGDGYASMKIVNAIVEIHENYSV